MNKIFITLLLCSLVMSVAGQDKAINYKELQEILPDAPLGYNTAGDPDGASFEMEGMSYSTASQEYEKGESYLTITLVDYQGAAAMYSMAAMAWSSGMAFEDDEQIANSVELNGHKGWQSYEKSDKISNLIIGYKDRYLVTIQASDVDKDFAQLVFKQLDLNKLP